MKKIIIILTALLFINLIVAEAQISANWRVTGPIAFPTNISGQINGIGRVTQIKFHPTDSTKIYATSASGGLWASTNAGLNWNHLGTDNMPWTQCASVCIDYTNDSIIYLGTGDPNYYGQGLGIWKSVDGGITFNPSNNNIGNRMALELLMDPSNDSILIAATDDGIWKSYDAGNSWQNKFSGSSFTDMKYKGTSIGDTLYAVTYSEYYRSIDRGETWSQITNGVVIPNGNGDGMRLGIGIDNSDVIYLGMVSDNGTILKSTDGGTTFSTVYNNPSQSLVGYDATSTGQGNYNFGITVDPLNSDRILLVAHCVWRSDDGGITWTKLTDWPSDCHTDMHQIIYNPYNHNNLFNANDGGIFVSHDDGDNWDPYCDGIEATECYHAAQSQLKTNIVSIGTQDNGELFYDNIWKTNRGGDWGERMMYDFQIYNCVYYFNGNRRIITAGDQSWSNPESNLTTMLFTPLQPNAAFVGGNDVYRTFSLHTNPPTWNKIATINQTVMAMELSATDSNDLYVVVAGNQIKHSINAFSPSPTFITIAAPSNTNNAASIALVKNNPNVVYITCGSKVYRSSNQGTSWTNITSNLPNINILKIFHDNYSTNESVYVGTARGVYYKNDTMNTWANYSQNLPSISDIQDFMMINDGSPNTRLRVAYYGRGVWESDMVQPNKIPAADFAGFPKVICPGNNVYFSDSSTQNTTTWNWSFPGGTPATATSKNVSVFYNTAGIYPVTLLSGNLNGGDTETKTNYIIVQPALALPIIEGFAGNFLPPYFSFQDAGDDGVNWIQSTTVGGYSLSTSCALFDNYNVDAGGKYDEIRTPQYDISTVSNLQLNFDVAYAAYGSPYKDSLAVLYTTDCDSTFTLIYLKDPVALSTAANLTTSTFVPLATEWRTETINLTNLIGQSKIAFAFQNRGNYGQALYIDNINISSSVGLNETEIKNQNISIYPNPTSGQFSLSVSNNTYNLSNYQVMNNLGQVILKNMIDAKQNQFNQSIDLSKYGKGVYLVSVFDKGGNMVKNVKVVVY